MASKKAGPRRTSLSSLGQARGLSVRQNIPALSFITTMSSDQELFESWFRVADGDKDGVVGGVEAVAFFGRSGLPQATLFQVKEEEGRVCARAGARARVVAGAVATLPARAVSEALGSWGGAGRREANERLRVFQCARSSHSPPHRTPPSRLLPTLPPPVGKASRMRQPYSVSPAPTEHVSWVVRGA